MATARDHPEVITKYLAEESEKGRVIDPLDPDQATHVRQISRFGVIPKGHTPGKWRLIVDLSAPAGSSINDGIEKSRCSLEYTSIDQAAALVNALGKNC